VRQCLSHDRFHGRREHPDTPVWTTDPAADLRFLRRLLDQPDNFSEPLAGFRAAAYGCHYI
jgi:hypothetical protein